MASAARRGTSPGRLSSGLSGIICIDVKINNQIAKTNGMFPAGHIQFNAQHTSTLPMVEEQWQDGKNVIIAPTTRADAKVVFPLPPNG